MLCGAGRFFLRIALLFISAIVLPIMVVRMRNNRSQTKQRRSHHGLKEANLSTCTNCGALHRPHHMCLDCGFYNGRQVMDLAAQKEKREARLNAKKDAIKGSHEEAPAPNNSPEPEKAELPTAEAAPDKTPAKDSTAAKDR